LIDMIENGNVTGAVAATKLAIDCLFAAAEEERPMPSQTAVGADLAEVDGCLWSRWRFCSALVLVIVMDWLIGLTKRMSVWNPEPHDLPRPGDWP
jgi:hypothetical protein